MRRQIRREKKEQIEESQVCSENTALVQNTMNEFVTPVTNSIAMPLHSIPRTVPQPAAHPLRFQKKSLVVDLQVSYSLHIRHMQADLSRTTARLTRKYISRFRGNWQHVALDNPRYNYGIMMTRYHFFIVWFLHQHCYNHKSRNVTYIISVNSSLDLCDPEILLVVALFRVLVIVSIRDI